MINRSLHYIEKYLIYSINYNNKYIKKIRPQLIIMPEILYLSQCHCQVCNTPQQKGVALISSCGETPLYTKIVF